MGPESTHSPAEGLGLCKGRPGAEGLGLGLWQIRVSTPSPLLLGCRQGRSPEFLFPPFSLKGR